MQLAVTVITIIILDKVRDLLTLWITNNTIRYKVIPDFWYILFTNVICCGLQLYTILYAVLLAVILPDLYYFLKKLKCRTLENLTRKIMKN